MFYTLKKYQQLEIIFSVSRNTLNVEERYLKSASTILFSSLTESYHVWKSNSTPFFVA